MSEALWRQVLHLLAASAVVLPVGSGATTAQTYPLRPVTMVVPFSAGGGTDVTARTIAAGLSETLGYPVVVENVPAAGGSIGAARVARAAPDGYQFVFGGVATHAYSQWMFAKPPYNAVDDFTPVALIAEQPLALVTRPNFPADTLQNFITYTKSNQTKMQYGSPGGVGSANHLSCVLLNVTMGVNVTHVPYRGAGPAFQDLMASRVDYQCPLAGSTVAPLIASKQMKAIAVFSKDRVRVLPNVPTADEQGLQDFEASTWQALFLPKATPAPIVEKLRHALVVTMDKPSIQEQLTQTGSIVVARERRSTEYLAKFVVSEIEKWGKVIRVANIKPE